MATSFFELAAELKAFDGRREVVNGLRKAVRKSVPPVRKSIKAAAKAELPARHGLNDWVAAISITSAVRVTGRKVGVALTGGRRSSGAQSDINAIDKGLVRAPSWGRRSKGNWHLQTVQPGFFTRTAEADPHWEEDIEYEVERAFDKIR